MSNRAADWTSLAVETIIFEDEARPFRTMTLKAKSTNTQDILLHVSGLHDTGETYPLSPGEILPITMPRGEFGGSGGGRKITVTPRSGTQQLAWIVNSG